MKDTYLSLAFVHGGTTQHSSLYTAMKVTTWGFGAKKKDLPVGSALHYVTQTLFRLSHKISIISISINMIRSVIRDLIRDPIRFDPGFVDADQNGCTVLFTRHQSNFVELFQYSDWLSR